jgi:predicted Zn-dependent protease
MKRLGFLALFVAGCALLYLLQRSKADAPFTPRPLLYLLADTQREAERIPLTVTRVSDQDEIKAGEQIAREYGLTSQRSDNPDAARISEYLNSVGTEVANHAQRKAIRYHFYLQDDGNFVNAFALPGGQIVVGRGLLELLESQDELAVVLGHEIAHVDNRHAIARLQYEMASRKIGLGEVYQLGKPAVEIFEAGYTKVEELEADRVGLGFAVAAGYSAAGGVNLMKRFEKLEPENAKRANSPVGEFAQVPFDALQEYFRSHPSPAERLAALEVEITSRGYDQSQSIRPLAIRSIFLTDAAERLDRAGDFKNSIARFKEALGVDPNYTRARRGLAESSWRSGDAEETVQAETEVIYRGAVTANDWRLLARGIAVSDSANGVSRLEALEAEKYATPNEGNDLYVAARIELAGLKFLNHRKDSFAEVQSLLSGFPQSRAIQQRSIAWWMYRAGKLDLASQHLEAARQLFPQSSETALQLALVLSDLGRQADAEQILSNEPIRSISQEDLAERLAVRAVIDWRTENRDAANRNFQSAVKADNVWMVPRWIANNNTASTAGIIAQLQAAESSRRLKEASARQLNEIGR